MRNVKINIFKIYFKRILLCGAETWTTTKRENSKIQAMEKKLLTAILKETKKGRIRNINIRLELGVDERKNDTQKSRLRWFGHVMQIRREDT